MLALSGVVISPNVSNAAAVCTPAEGKTYNITAGIYKLCSDTTEDIVVSDENVTIDLNNHTMSGNVTVKNGKTLTIKDDSEAEGGAFSGTIITKLGEGQTITIEGGKFSGTVFGNTADGATAKSGIHANDKIVIKGGDFTNATVFGNALLNNIINDIEQGIFSKSENPAAYAKNGKKVFTAANAYVVAEPSTILDGAGAEITNATKVALPVNGKKATSVFQLNFAASSYGEVANELTFSVTDAATSKIVASGKAGDLSSYFTVTTKTIEVGGNKKTKSDDAVKYNFIANKAGKYIVTATSNDGVEASITVNAYAFNEEATLKNIYVNEAVIADDEDDGTDKTITINLADQISDYIDDAEGVTATISTTDPGLAVADETKLKVKEGATPTEHKFTVNIGGTEIARSVYVLAEPSDTYQFVELIEDKDNGGYKATEDVALPTIWNIKNNKSGVATVTRDTDDDGAAVATVTIAPASVGTATTTYSLSSDAWIYNAGENELVTDEEEVAEAVKDVKYTATFYTYEVNREVTLKAGESEQATGIVKFDTANTELSIEATNKTTEDERVTTLDGSKITANAGTNKADEYTFTLKSTATPVTRVVGTSSGHATDPYVKVYTYTAAETGIKDTTKYNKVTTSNSDVALKTTPTNDPFYVANPDAILATESENVVLSGDHRTATYTATGVGSETVAYSVMLGDTEIDSFSVTYNTYGLGIDGKTFYVQPGQEFSLAVEDPYGTVSVKSVENVTTANEAAFKNYDYENGVFTMSSDSEGKFEATFRDVVTADTGSVIAPIVEKITVVVADTYVTASEDNFTIDVTEGAKSTDKFTIDATSGTIDYSVKSAFDAEDETDYKANISLKAISKKDGTYQITATDTNANFLPGTYVMTINLTDGANVKASTEVTVKVVKNADIDEGVFTINSKVADKMVLDVKAGDVASGANIQLYKSNDTLAQQFHITKNDDDTYTITNVKSNNVLDVSGGNSANGTNVQQYAANGSLAQKWIVRYADGVEIDPVDDTKNTFTFVSALDDNMVLDLAAGGKTNGTNAQIYENNATKAQQWSLTRVELSDAIKDVNDEPVIEKNAYTIASALDSNKVLDVLGRSTADGANVQLYSGNGTTAQQFKFVADDAGFYTIANVESGKVLDVTAAGRDNGTNVQQYTANGTMAQKWILEQDDNGFVTFKSAHSGLYLDIAAARTADGTNVQVYKGNGTKAQKFRLVKVED